MDKVDIRIEDWKRKLIDPTRRNRLLFFIPTRGSSLKVIQPSPAEVFRRLVVEEKSWKFFSPQEEIEEQDKFVPDLTLPLTVNAEKDQPKPAKPVRSLFLSRFLVSPSMTRSNSLAPKKTLSLIQP